MTETVFVEVEVSFTSIFDQLVEDFFDPYAASTTYEVPVFVDEVGTVATNEDGTAKMVEVDVWDIREPEPWTPGIEGFVHLLEARIAARHDQTYTAWTKGDGLALRAALDSGQPPPWTPVPIDPAGQVDPADPCLCWQDGDDTGYYTVTEDCPVHGPQYQHTDPAPRQLNPPPQQRGAAPTVTQMLPFVERREDTGQTSLLGLQEDEEPSHDG